MAHSTIQQSKISHARSCLHINVMAQHPTAQLGELLPSHDTAYLTSIGYIEGPTVTVSQVEVPLLGHSHTVAAWFDS